MINLDVPAKFAQLVDQAHQAAAEFFRPHSRKYDQAEHTYPRELDMLAALLDGLAASGGGAGAGGVRRGGAQAGGNQNGANLRLLLGTIEMCWGDVGLLLSMPRQGLGNAAIASVANDEQLARYQGKWAAMAITEPDTGSDSGAIRTTAVLDGDHYVLNGEKIFVTAGERADCVVVWATLDRSRGKAAIKSFVVDRGTPGFTLVRLEHKLGIRASDTAHFRLEDVRVHKDNLLGSPDIQGFAGVMQTFDNTRPLVAAMAVGVARAALEETHRILTEAGIPIDYDRPALTQPAAAATYLQLEADWEAAYLLSLQAAWMADNRKPNSLQASMAKAKAGRTATDITLRCVELTGSLGYSENSLLEKWSRDSKILDIFEGTQQIQQLIVARRLLGKSSTELK
ncbi:acyl-CoA dehydrogenase family protein [Actinokineospora globicatena]|uniref:acyl-CoA dehydrogenase family protein n=1 Tax=Actinokineospora globicatena TaxID=103729 RepID=UPI0020A57C09|nr:acyl-CoA dehydrogenase family protein [Actinokineospora globicatena]MCP2302202.1 acyl-CoA dehydrogenase [Actinokineospora globicatena]GLW76134.1 acyl-CoA dehydrogenase [Actinokineospora globicatena]GLW82970.1 acyl-CoA dehydrogenase [Actinokineospora globicatena]